MHTHTHTIMRQTHVPENTTSFVNIINCWPFSHYGNHLKYSIVDLIYNLAALSLQPCIIVNSIHWFLLTIIHFLHTDFDSPSQTLIYLYQLSFLWTSVNQLRWQIIVVRVFSISRDTCSMYVLNAITLSVPVVNKHTTTFLFLFFLLTIISFLYIYLIYCQQQ